MYGVPVQTSMELSYEYAQMKDQHYKYYLDHYRKIGPLETKLGILCEVKEIMYGMLDPNPDTRDSIGCIVATDWFKGIECCVSDDGVLVDNQPLPHIN
jgi:hypothetical protein